MGELTCKCGCGGCNMNTDFMIKLEKIRDEWYRQSNRVLKVSSGYRCKSHNRAVSKFASKDGSGPHTFGKAVDITISGRDSKILYKIAKKHMTGIGISRNYIHLDSLTSAEAPRPTVWRYS
jgi:uncharacterized protein YcbK (DUF882 family)